MLLEAFNEIYKKAVYPALTYGAVNRLVAHDRFTRVAQVLEYAPPSIVSGIRNQLNYVNPQLKTTILGKELAHPFMVSAGVDKNAKALAIYYAAGAAGEDVGSIIFQDYPGHPDGVYAHALVDDDSFLNRISYKSDGSTVIEKRIARFISKFSLDDYLLTTNVGATQKAFEKGQAVQEVNAACLMLKKVGNADIFNTGSPNTDAHQDLKLPENLYQFLGQVISGRANMGVEKPLGVKLPIDVSESILREQIDVLRAYKIPVVVIANTSTDPEIIARTTKYKDLPGGRSGACITELGNNQSEFAYQYLRSLGEEDKMSIIRSAGVVFPKDAWDAISFGGARGIELCTALFLPKTTRVDIFRYFSQTLANALENKGIESLDLLRGSRISYSFTETPLAMAV